MKESEKNTSRKRTEEVGLIASTLVCLTMDGVAHSPIFPVELRDFCRSNILYPTAIAVGSGILRILEIV